MTAVTLTVETSVQAAAVPAYLVAQPDEVVRFHPVINRPQVLPFAELTWQNFERLLFRLASLTATVVFVGANHWRDGDPARRKAARRQTLFGQYLAEMGGLVEYSGRPRMQLHPWGHKTLVGTQYNHLNRYQTEATAQNVSFFSRLPARRPVILASSSTVQRVISHEPTDRRG